VVWFSKFSNFPFVTLLKAWNEILILIVECDFYIKILGASHKVCKLLLFVFEFFLQQLWLLIEYCWTIMFGFKHLLLASPTKASLLCLDSL
jgi:hypothetical protein